MDCSTPGFPVHHQLQELAYIHVNWVGDAIQPSHPLSSPSPPILTYNPGLVNSLLTFMSKLARDVFIIHLGQVSMAENGWYRKGLDDAWMSQAGGEGLRPGWEQKADGGEGCYLVVEGRLGLPALGWGSSLSSGLSCPLCLFGLGRHLLHSLEPVVPSSLHLHPKLIEEALWLLENKSKPSAFSSSSPCSSGRMASKFQHWNGPENLFKMLFFSAKFEVTELVASLYKRGNSFFKHLIEK